MAKLAIYTSSYEGDLESFEQLHRSLLRYTSDDVIHHVAVPDRDVELFQRVGSPRMRITRASELLPQRFRSTYGATRALRRTPLIGRHVPPIQAINVRHPWPPVRGWILQQLVKLEAVAVHRGRRRPYGRL